MNSGWIYQLIQLPDQIHIIHRQSIRGIYSFWGPFWQIRPYGHINSSLSDVLLIPVLVNACSFMLLSKILWTNFVVIFLAYFWTDVLKGLIHQCIFNGHTMRFCFLTCLSLKFCKFTTELFLSLLRCTSTSYVCFRSKSLGEIFR